MIAISLIEGSRLDLSAFRNYGVFVIRDCFSDRETTELVSVWNDFYESDLRNNRLVGANGASAQDLCETVPDAIARLYKHPRLVALMNSIYGENVVFCQQRILIKDHHFGGGVPGHQDFSYYRGGMNKVGLFVPLTLCHPRNGGLHFVLKSHKFGYLGERGYIPSPKLLPPHLDKLEVVSPTVRPGDVMLMDICTWHFSLDSETGESRVYVNPYYQPATDGSYDTLLSGAWQTDTFWRDHDIASLLTTESQIHAAELRKLRERQ